MVVNNKIRILIADDNKEFTAILCEYIELYGSQCIEVAGVANNGIEAVEMILSKKPDIVILDIIMPYLDGIGVVERINAMNMKKMPLIIILSAVNLKSVIQTAMNLDAVYYIEKPVEIDVLISKIISLQSAILINKDFSDL